MKIFVGVRFDIEVVTVTHDRDGKPRAPEHWYSIVRQIHPCKAGQAGERTLQPSNPLPSNPPTQGTLTTDQHSNTANTPLAEEAEKANQKLVSLRTKRETSE
jgi:hypothetical protein